MIIMLAQYAQKMPMRLHAATHGKVPTPIGSTNESEQAAAISSFSQISCGMLIA